MVISEALTSTSRLRGKQSILVAQCVPRQNDVACEPDQMEGNHSWFNQSYP